MDEEYRVKTLKPDLDQGPAEGGASGGGSFGSLALPTSGAGVEAAGTSEGLGDTAELLVIVVVVVAAG